MPAKAQMDFNREQVTGALATCFSTERSPHDKTAPPVEMAFALARMQLGALDSDKARRVLEGLIAKTLEAAKTPNKYPHTRWEEVDRICAQALTLCLSAPFNDTSGLGWAERDQKLLAYLINLFWKLPDRILAEAEEKTNGTYYTYHEPCMLETKRIIFSRVVSSWDIDGDFAKARQNYETAFTFVNHVFTKSNERQTTEPNLSFLRRQSWSGIIYDARELIEEDQKMFLDILKEHLRHAKLKDLRKWVRDDLPEPIFKLFQKALIKGGDRRLVTALLRGEAAA